MVQTRFAGECCRGAYVVILNWAVEVFGGNKAWRITSVTWVCRKLFGVQSWFGRISSGGQDAVTAVECFRPSGAAFYGELSQGSALELMNFAGCAGWGFLIVSEIFEVPCHPGKVQSPSLA